MSNRISRRDFLLGAGGLAIGATAAWALKPAAQQPEQSQSPRNRALRIAFLSDVHVQSWGNAPDGMARALRHAHALADKPDVIFNGGDAIMEALAADKQATQAQWDLWNSVLREECALPIVHCIGNHDVWGWLSTDPTIQSDPLYGKGFPLQQLGLEHPYYSFDRAGWHFIVLDSSFQAGNQYGYIGRLDDGQFNWLREDLESTSSETPVCVVSHIPILCVSEFYDGENEVTGNWVVPGAWMHIDSRRVKDLFRMHNNVTLCLSGHAHQIDRADYHDVKYLGNGAVCGAWWQGAYLGFPPAYVVVDLYDDGSSESEAILYE
jgi:predicted MPP superfamily phosphohydrolase